MSRPRCRWWLVNRNWSFNQHLSDELELPIGIIFPGCWNRHWDQLFTFGCDSGTVFSRSHHVPNWSGSFRTWGWNDPFSNCDRVGKIIEERRSPFVFHISHEPLCRYFLSILTWRSALMANALVSSILFICGLLMKDLEPTNHSSPSSIKKFRQFSTSQKFCLGLFCLNNLFYLLGISIVMMHVVAFVDENGIITKDHCPMIISFIGICNLMGRIVLGFICRWKTCSSVLVYIFSNVVSGLAVLLIVCKVQTCGKFSQPAQNQSSVTSYY